MFTSPINFDTAAHRHGTLMTGIVGALRNNSLGIAGIAGGDMNIGDSGAELYVYQAGTPRLSGWKILLSYAESAIERAITVDAVDVLCLAFGGPDYYASQHEIIRFALNSGTTVVTAAGNEEVSPVYYPGLFDDGMIVVGATDEWGRRYGEYAYDPTITSWVRSAQVPAFIGSNYGNGLDFMAPGVTLLTRTTYPPSDGMGTNGYGVFAGTSGASAHVTGVAALMKRHYKAQASQRGDAGFLATEDVERVLERTAFDLDRNAPSPPNQYFSYATQGVDQYTGYGLIDAGAAIAQIHYPDYRIAHLEIPMLPSQAQDLGIDSFYLKEYYRPYLKGSPFHLRTFRIDTTITFNFPGWQVEAAWARNSASDGWGAAFSKPGRDDLDSDTKIIIDSWNQSGVNLHTFYYDLWAPPHNFVNDHWPKKYYNWKIGVDPDTPKAAISLLLRNTTTSTRQYGGDPI
ncbi:MAG: S8/S53 family peptidase [Bacteroidia bacterium]